MLSARSRREQAARRARGQSEVFCRAIAAAVAGRARSCDAAPWKLLTTPARELAQRVVMMDRGSVVLSGRREELDETEVRRHLSV